MLDWQGKQGALRASMCLALKYISSRVGTGSVFFFLQRGRGSLKVGEPLGWTLGGMSEVMQVHGGVSKVTKTAAAPTNSELHLEHSVQRV